MPQLALPQLIVLFCYNGLLSSTHVRRRLCITFASRKVSVG